MKVFKVISVAAFSALFASSCSHFKAKEPAQQQHPQQKSAGVQTEEVNKGASDKAISLTQGWPQSSVVAAKEIVSKHGEPTEVTQDSLIWKNAQPFKRIIVHKEVYSSRFPLLHQNAVEHVVDYKAPASEIKDLWNYNGSVILDRVRGEMAAGGANEAMNFLSLNLAHEVLQSKRSPESARVQHGKDTLAYMNGEKTANTQALSFGNQINTADSGQPITDKIRWAGEKKPASKGPSVSGREAEEEAPKK